MRRLAFSLTLATLTAGFGCDSTPSKRDASAGGQRVAEVAVRLDAPSGGTPSASVLAYRAGVTGRGRRRRAVGDRPAGGRRRPRPAACAGTWPSPPGPSACTGARSSSRRWARWRWTWARASPDLRPLSRVYPELASAVGGVVSEAGPIDLTVAPADAGPDRRDQRPPPGGDGAGAAPPAGRRRAWPCRRSVAFDPGADLVLGVAGPARDRQQRHVRRAAAVRRHLGAVLRGQASGAGFNGDSYVVIPAAELGRLAELRVPVSLEAVVRETSRAGARFVARCG